MSCWSDFRAICGGGGLLRSPGAHADAHRRGNFEISGIESVIASMVELKGSELANSNDQAFLERAFTLFGRGFFTFGARIRRALLSQWPSPAFNRTRAGEVSFTERLCSARG